MGNNVKYGPENLVFQPFSNNIYLIFYFNSYNLFNKYSSCSEKWIKIFLRNFAMSIKVLWSALMLNFDQFCILTPPLRRSLSYRDWPANQWTGFYMIRTSIMKDSNLETGNEGLSQVPTDSENRCTLCTIYTLEFPVITGQGYVSVTSQNVKGKHWPEVG